MEIHETKEYKAVFDDRELKTIMTCLDYCSHRMKSHAGIITKPERVDRIRKEIREFLEVKKK